MFPTFLIPISILAGIAAVIGMYIKLTGRDQPNDRR